MDKEEPIPTLVKDDDSKHLALFIHGDDAHSFMSVPQLTPMKPTLHVHRYTPYTTLDPGVPDSVQVAPLAHGSEEHSFVSHRTVYAGVADTAHASVGTVIVFADCIILTG